VTPTHLIRNCNENHYPHDQGISTSNDVYHRLLLPFGIH